MAVLPATVPIQHRVWTANTDPVRHGQSGEGTLAEPVQRFAIQVYPMSWTNPDQDPITVDAAGRTVTDLLVDVEDPSLYKKNDEILINGVSFVVQGLPGFDDVAMGPLPEFEDLLGGGTVHVRRVT